MKKHNRIILNLFCGMAFSFMFLAAMTGCEDSGNGEVDNEALVALQEAVDDNTADISTNAADISTNAADISTNAAAVSTNATDIAANTSNISTNAADISTNAAAVSTNATDIAANSSAIANNAAGISANTANIGANANDIAANADGIAANATAIYDHDQNINAHQNRMAKAFGFVNDTFLGTVYGTENVSSVAWNSDTMNPRYEITLDNRLWVQSQHCSMQVTPYTSSARYATASVDGGAQPILYVFIHDVDGNLVRGSFHWTLHCY